MSLLCNPSPFEATENVCKICETNHANMGSIICAENDNRLLEKIYKSTNVRVQPRSGIITPICENCHSRIDAYDDNFKPYFREYFVDAASNDTSFKSFANHVSDPLEDDSFLGDKSEDFKSEDGSDASAHSRNYGETLRLDDQEGIFTKHLSGHGRKEHVQSSHSKRTAAKKPSECPICGKFVKSMTDHMKTHCDDKKYKCTLCDKSFAQSNNLTYHIRKHTGEKPFRCDVCDKKFICSTHLNSHMKFHYNEQPFQCEVCSKRFNQMGNLKKHLRLHSSGEKPYSCVYCDKKFNNLSNKKCHEKRHRGERDYSCEVCSKSFYDSNHLKRHREVHQKKTKVACGLCSKTFKTLRCLRKHTLEHEKNENLKCDGTKNEKIHKCGSCYKAFAKGYQLRNHARRVHEKTKSIAVSSGFSNYSESVR